MTKDDDKSKHIAIGGGSDLGTGIFFRWLGKGPRPPFPTQNRHSISTWNDYDKTEPAFKWSGVDENDPHESGKGFLIKAHPSK